MQLLLADLLCPNCRAYAHPFLERCLGCGAPRSSRYPDALADAAGEPSLLDDPAYGQAAAEVSAKYVLSAHRSGMLGTMGAEGVFGADGTQNRGPAPFEIADDLGSQLTYRGSGLRANEAVDVVVHADANSVRFLDPKRQVLEAVDPALILGVAPQRAGSAAAVRDHGVVMWWYAGGVQRQVTLANPHRFLSARARFDHYLDLARWIGVMSAASAQARWRAIGAAAYAAEIGLRSPAPASGIRAAAAPPGSSPGGRSARERLEELESLRAAGLVTADEYDQKRREILASL